MGVHVQFKNVTVSYGRKTALRDVSLEIPERRIFAVIGPANSGKTTFLKCINRTIDFVASAKVRGRVSVDGEDVFAIRNVYELRRKVGMVFPLPVGLPLSVYENVAYAPRRAGIHARHELDEIVETCLRQAMLWEEVKDRLNKPALGLSGGQQQRLCIARCLAVELEVILMDEPTSALDPVATSKIEGLLEELAEKYTIVIVTHNMQQAARVSDYTSFFLSGKVIETDKTEVIFSNPANKKTEDYITGRFG